MKKQFLVILISFWTATALSAQEYKLAKSTGQLNIVEVNTVRIEGYSGKEVVFSSNSFNRDKDDRAKGLRAVSSMGLEDNTGLGLSVLEKDGIVEVRQLKKMDGPNILIKVPQGMKINYTHTSPHGSNIRVKDVEGELNISTVHNDVNLENVTGPLKITTVHGDIDAYLGEIKNVVMLSSTHGHVDLAIPASTKANLKLDTSWGEIFVDPDFKLEIDKAGNMMKYSDRMTAKINGGGVDISLSSTHDNVYLRKK